MPALAGLGAFLFHVFCHNLSRLPFFLISLRLF